MPKSKQKCWKPTLLSEKLLLFALITTIIIITIVMISLIFHVKSDKLILQQHNESNVCVSRACIQAAADLLSNMDMNADPCEDFYQFACGDNSKKINLLEEIASGKFDEKMVENMKQIKKIIGHPWKPNEPHYYKLVKDFYSSCLNTSKIEELGATPLLKALQQLGSWEVLYGPDWNEYAFNWSEELIKFRNMGIDTNTFFELTVSTDFLDPSVHILLISEPRLTFPKANYYKKRYFRENYLQFMVNVAVLLGAPKSRAERELQIVLEFETELVEVLIPEEDKRNYTKLHNIYTVSELQGLLPKISWGEFIGKMKPSDVISSSENVLVLAPHSLRKLSNLLSHTSNRVTANYMLWKFIRENCHLFHKAIAEMCFKFRQEFLGSIEKPARKQYCISKTFSNFPVASSSIFIKNFFDPKSKSLAKELARSIKVELKNGLSNAQWMDSETMAKALEKANAMSKFIGYPEELLDDSKLDDYYAGLTITDDEYFHNTLHVNKFFMDKKFAELSMKAEELRWAQFGGDAAMSNAKYDAATNRIQIFAGILGGAFFNPNWPEYLNYGGIGSIIGHELTHGFDNKGKQFGPDGTLQSWWDNETSTKFRERADSVVQQYSKFVVPEVNITLNGFSIQVEAISDIEGVKLAYKAYEKFENENGEERGLPGLTFSNRQLFWLKFANVWCTAESEEVLIHTQSRSHPPNRFRILGPVMNSEDFSKDFSCPKNSPMNPKEKISFWTN